MTSTFSTATARVVIHDSHSEPVVSVAVQLLDVLGYDVLLAETSDDALRAATSGRTDLLVLSLTDLADQANALERLAMLPAAHRPRQVAILSDEEDVAGMPLQRKLPDVKVHVFVKPMQAHGLLKVIKRISGGMHN